MSGEVRSDEPMKVDKIVDNEIKSKQENKVSLYFDCVI